MTVFLDRPDLLRDFRQGKRAALEEVYWAYVNVVEKVVRRGAVRSSTAQLGGAVGDEWSDVVQETFLRAFAERARLGYDGIRPYRPYLLTICRNVMADHSRRRGREAPSELLVEDLLDVADGVDDPPEAAWADAE